MCFTLKHKNLLVYLLSLDEEDELKDELILSFDDDDDDLTI